MADILIGKYTYIYTSPKLAINRLKDIVTDMTPSGPLPGLGLA